MEEFIVIVAPSSSAYPSVRFIKNLPDEEALPVTGSITGAATSSPVCDSGDSSSTCTISTPKVLNGLHTFHKLIIAKGGSITHDAGYSPDKTALTLKTVYLTIEKGGIINLDSKGWPGSQGPGAENNEVVNKGVRGVVGCSGGGGGGHGGKGGDNGGDCSSNNDAGRKGGVSYDDVQAPSQSGSGGGGSGAGATGPFTDGGPGGGALEIIAERTLKVDGIISANGADQSQAAQQPGGGGGSGGSIILRATNIIGTGSISANGGEGAGGLPYQNNGIGGGGAGGRIALYYDVKTLTGGITVTGGKGANTGEQGTIYEERSPPVLSVRQLPDMPEGSIIVAKVGNHKNIVPKGTQAVIITRYSQADGLLVSCSSIPVICS